MAPSALRLGDTDVPFWVVVDTQGSRVLAERPLNGGAVCVFSGARAETAVRFMVEQLRLMSAKPVYRWVPLEVLSTLCKPGQVERALAAA